MSVEALATMGAYYTALRETNYSHHVRFTCEAMAELAVGRLSAEAALDQLRFESVRSDLPFEEWQAGMRPVDTAHIEARIALQEAHQAIEKQADLAARMYWPQENLKTLDTGVFSRAFAFNGPAGTRLVTKVPLETYVPPDELSSRIQHVEWHIPALLAAAGTITGQPPIPKVEMPFAVKYATGGLTTTYVPGDKLGQVPLQRLENITDEELDALHDTLSQGADRNIWFDFKRDNLHVAPDGIYLYDYAANDSPIRRISLSWTLQDLRDYLMKHSRRAEDPQRSNAFTALAGRVQARNN